MLDGPASRSASRSAKSLFFFFFTLLCSIVLVRLAVALPYVAIKVVEIVRRHVRDAVQLEEVRLCGQSTERAQQPPQQHRGSGGAAG